MDYKMSKPLDLVFPYPSKKAVPYPPRRGRPPKYKLQHGVPVPNENYSTTVRNYRNLSTKKLSKEIQKENSSVFKQGENNETIKANISERKRKLELNIQVDKHQCDYCHQITKLRTNGQYEPLLCCISCTAKGHPSCMGYTSALARRALREKWQCMECKTCSVCDDAGKAGKMLFCDGCDKGYHMACHNPPLLKKPTGRWDCAVCQKEKCHLKKPKPASEQDQYTIAEAPLTPDQSPQPTLTRDALPTEPCFTGLTSYPNAAGWSCSDVVTFLHSAGFSDIETKVFIDQEIDGVALLLLKRADILGGLGLKLGPALKLSRLIQGLQTAGETQLSS